MTRRNTGGQAVVELAIVVPILLLMVAGLYVACRTGFLASGAQSAAQTEALRVGRGLPGIERHLSATLLPGDNVASIRGEGGQSARLLPAPFPSLAGRSTGIASLNKEWRETGTIGEFPPLALVRKTVVSTDCWNGDSASGKRIRRVIKARIALGAIP